MISAGPEVTTAGTIRLAGLFGKLIPPGVAPVVVIAITCDDEKLGIGLFEASSALTVSVIGVAVNGDILLAVITKW